LAAAGRYIGFSFWLHSSIKTVDEPAHKWLQAQTLQCLKSKTKSAARDWQMTSCLLRKRHQEHTHCSIPETNNDPSRKMARLHQWVSELRRNGCIFILAATERHAMPTALSAPPLPPSVTPGENQNTSPLCKKMINCQLYHLTANEIGHLSHV
jgi:hypothetical protein